MITLKRKPPLNLNQNDVHLFSREYVREIQGTGIIPLQNIIICGNGICYQHFKAIKESTANPDCFNQYDNKYLLKSLLHFKYAFLPPSDPCILAFDEWSFGYFHWLTDTLQRLYAAKDYYVNHHVLIPDHFREQYHLQALEALGIKKIKYIKKNQVSFARNLFFSQHVATTGNNDPHLINKISDTLKKYFIKNSTGEKEKIYISRMKASRRKILNEQDVIRLLKNYNYEIICFEDLPFSEQVNIMHHSKYLISIHGAGLTNMMFMQPGGNVLELRRENDAQNNCYFSLASDFNLNYYYQTCLSSDANLSTQEDNIVVDIEVLKKNVELMTANQFIPEEIHTG